MQANPVAAGSFDDENSLPGILFSLLIGGSTWISLKLHMCLFMHIHIWINVYVYIDTYMYNHF